MPEIRPEHRIEFHVTDPESDVVITPIPNPTYIYRVGDKFRYFAMTEKDIELHEFEVVEVTHELQDHAIGEQVVVVHVKEITDAISKSTS